MCDKINTAANGRLVVDCFPAGAVTPALKELEAVHSGALEGGSFAYEVYVYLLPEAGPFGSLAGGPTSVQKMLWWEGGGGDDLARRLLEPLNVVHVANYLVTPPEVWAHSNKELKTTADLKGLKMRCAGEGGEILARMGAATVFFPGGELYESLQRGVIDACEYGPLQTNWGMAFHEVAKYLYLNPNRAPGGSAGFAVNKGAWEKLPDDLKQMVEDAVRSEPIKWYSETIQLDAKALKSYMDYGTIVESLPKEINDEFIKTANQFFDEKAAEMPLYGEVLQSLREFKELCELQDIR